MAPWYSLSQRGKSLHSWLLNNTIRQTTYPSHRDRQRKLKLAPPQDSNPKSLYNLLIPPGWGQETLHHRAGRFNFPGRRRECHGASVTSDSLPRTFWVHPCLSVLGHFLSVEPCALSFIGRLPCAPASIWNSKLASNKGSKLVYTFTISFIPQCTLATIHFCHSKYKKPTLSSRRLSDPQTRHTVIQTL